LDMKETLTDKRWGIIAIVLGILVGFFSALICIRLNLVIFGFNVMYILSPLTAGFVETVIANRKYGKSTGAISALITFILINFYGWVLYGYITNNPTTFNLITLIAIIMNYILFVIGLSIIRRVIEFMIFLPSRIRGKPLGTGGKEEISGPSTDEIFLDELSIPIVSVPYVPIGKIKRNVGLVTGEAIAEEKESKGFIMKLTNIIKPAELEDIYLGEAKKKAISRMLEDAKLNGANTVIDVLIDYVSVGGFQGNAFIVTATGTAVVSE